VKPTATHEEAGKQGGRGNKKASNNVTSFKRGNTQEYLVRRLKRAAPEIAQALGCGEYRSARAAAKAAGIIKELTPLEAAKRAWRKMSATEKQQFLRFIREATLLNTGGKGL
jgi:hypothetical protein